MGLTVLEIEVGNPANPEIVEKIVDPLRRDLKPLPMILAPLERPEREMIATEAQRQRDE